MDEGLFKTIYEATHNQLLAYLRHLAGKAQAEDVMQETYIRLLNHPPRKNDPIAQRSWLFTTATRLLRDQWRKDRAFSWTPWSPQSHNAKGSFRIRKPGLNRRST